MQIIIKEILSLKHHLNICTTNQKTFNNTQRVFLELVSVSYRIYIYCFAYNSEHPNCNFPKALNIFKNQNQI